MTIHRRVVVRGIASLGALALVAALAVSAAAQPAPVRVVQSSDGTLFVVQSASAWTLVPDPISDTDLAGLTPAGEIDGTLGLQSGPPHVVQASDGSLYLVGAQSAWTLVPDQISDDDLAALTKAGELDGVIPADILNASSPAAVTQEPISSSAPTPRPGATVVAAQPGSSQATSTPTPLSTVEGIWTGRLDQSAGLSFAITLTVHMSGNSATGTWRAVTLDGRYYIVRNLAGTFTNSVLQVSHTTTVDQTAPPPGISWCPPNNAVDILTLTDNRLDGTQAGACGSGVVHLTKGQS